MSESSTLDFLPLWGVFAGTLVVMLGSFEFGYRLGIWRRRTTNREKESPVSAMVAAQLGLLAFLLAFTFGVASSRLDDRRRALMEESNAIGTTYLRAAMLPEPSRAEIHQLLRNYVDVRLEGAKRHNIDETVRRSEEMHNRLWAEATTVAEKDARSIPIGLFIQSLNEVIDSHAKRLQAIVRSRVPGTVWLVLYAVAILSFGALGYDAGLSSSSRSPAVLAVALTFAAVLWLVADLDRPHEGLLRVNQQPMIDLRNSMTGPSS